MSPRMFESLLLFLLLPAEAASSQGLYSAQLSGANQVPPVASPATGVGKFALNSNDTLTYYVATSGLSSPITSIHIHSGMVTVVGPILSSLVTAGETACGTTPALTQPQKTLLLAGALYVDIHTTNYGGGEIRGQIRPPIWADLAGANTCTLPPPAGIGTFGAIVNPNASISYACRVEGTTGGPTLLHLHGSLGPCLDGGLLLPLPSPVGPAGGPYTSAGTTVPQGSATISALNNGGAYADIHTFANPAGALRGDLQGGTLPVSTPGGCAGTGGITPFLGWMGGPPRLGLPGPFAARVSGALPGSSSFLIAGTWNGSPFPFDLQTILGGSGSCVLLSDFPVLLPGTIAGPGPCAGEGHHLFPSLAGATLGGTVYLQVAVVDSGSPLFAPVVLSNGLSVTIQ